MARTTPKKPTRLASPDGIAGVERRLASFVAEQFPLVATPVCEALAAPLRSAAEAAAGDAGAIDRLRAGVRETLSRSAALPRPPKNAEESTPGVAATERVAQAHAELLDAIDGFLARESIAASFSNEERRELLRGMILTRATDNQLKRFFLGGQVRYRGTPFQGKGFRSLGQEAIYAAALRLRRGSNYRDPDGSWHGDIVAPLIRDVGVALAMDPSPETVRMVLMAQMGKAGPPMDGKDLHIGDLSRGILPAAAPLAISSLTVAGLAIGFARQNEERVAVSFIGEGGSSLGEWHEAINVCAARKLPAVFCLQNNQTALSTPVVDQSCVRVFADKARGYGIPGLTLDGTDPEAIAAAFTWAAERARSGGGPALI